MASAKSFRLPTELVALLGQRAAHDGVSQTELLTSLLDEGLKVRAFPGVVYRDGPTGRRAAIAVGPDVWEIIGAIQRARGTGDGKVRTVARTLGLDPSWVRLAVEFYAAHPREVDERIAANEAAADRARELAERHERLLA